MDFSSLDVDCFGAGGSPRDTAYAGVLLSPTRLPEPGATTQMVAGVLSLAWLARRKKAQRSATRD